jgi:hypothetical protein
MLMARGVWIGQAQARLLAGCGNSDLILDSRSVTSCKFLRTVVWCGVVSWGEEGWCGGHAQAQSRSLVGCGNSGLILDSRCVTSCKLLSSAGVLPTIANAARTCCCLPTAVFHARRQHPPSAHQLVSIRLVQTAGREDGADSRQSRRCATCTSKAAVSVRAYSRPRQLLWHSSCLR